MTESELEVAAVHKLSPLQVFFAKVAIVTVALVIVLYAAAYFTQSFIESKMESLQVQSGPAFWGTIERKLYTLADEPDLSPEKKKRMIEALRRLSSKYRPYVDALAGDSSPTEPKSR